MQNDRFIDYSPIPDSPFPDLNTPPVVTPSMRSDAMTPLTSRRQRNRLGVQRPYRRWADVIEEETSDSRQEQGRRIVKGKWSRRCKTQSCKNPFRPRPPPPPPPASAASGLVHLQKPIAAHGGTRTRANRSNKCKNRRCKCRTRRACK